MNAIKDVQTLQRHLKENASEIEIFATSKATTSDKAKLARFLANRKNVVVVGVQS